MIVVICDATIKIGYGHVKRCLALACVYRQLGMDITFVMKKPLPMIKDLVLGYGMGVKELLDHEKSLCFLMENKDRIRLVIVDHYELDAAFEKKIFQNFSLLVVDDLCRSHWCNILVDQTLNRVKTDYQAMLCNSRATLLTGTAYALLDPVYQGVVSSRNRDHILVSFGATDPGKAAVKVLTALAPFVKDKHLVFHLPLSSASPCLEDLNRLQHKSGLCVKVYTDLNNLSALYRQCGIAIGAPGISLLERIYCGLANITLVVAENQETAGKNFSDQGLAPCLGSIHDLDPLQLARALNQLIHVSEPVQAAHENNSCPVDGFGAVRVVCRTLDLISATTLRRATAEDKVELFRFQHEKNARQYCRNPGLPEWEEHGAWFARTLADEKIQLYMIEWNGTPIGYVRLEGKTGKEVSILVSQAFQGFGFAKKALRAAMKDKTQIFTAHIHPENTHSIRLFTHAGFRLLKKGVYIHGN